MQFSLIASKMDKIITLLLLTISLNHVAYMSPVLTSSSEDIIEDGTENQEVADANSSEYPSEILEEVKSRILKVLHKSEPPKTHVPLPTLQTLDDVNVFDGNESFRQMRGNKTEDIKTDFLPAEVDNDTISTNGGLLGIRMHFNLVPQDNFQGAELWLHKKQDITEFSITHIISITGKEEIEKKTISVYNQTSSNEWIRFDVSHLISAQNFSTLSFEVSTTSGEMCLDVEEEKKPFLLIYTNSDLKRHSKRSVSECGNGSSSCCLEKLYIHFKDINYGEWIIHPEGYELNYCNGSCPKDVDMALMGYYHAQIFKAFCENKPQRFRETGKGECLNCSPTEYSAISIIYLDEEGVRVLTRMPGMSVAKCGCV